jgi:hypothetical protein
MRPLLSAALLSLATAIAAPAHARGPGENPFGPAAWTAPERFAAALKYTGLTYHPGGGENAEHYKRSLDDGDYWVVMVGAQADLDYKLLPFLYLRGSVAGYKDCADLWAGYYHLGFRANWDVNERLSVRIGIGPTYLWRQNWLGKVKDYERDSFFGEATGGDFQGAFIWYGGCGMEGLGQGVPGL